MAHELASAFENAGLPLCNKLVEMLDEHPSHQTERRGCGLTQATRRLAERINQPRDPVDAADLSLFEGWPLRLASGIGQASRARGWAAGWRALDQAPEEVQRAIAPLPGAAELLALPGRLRDVARAPLQEESRLLLALLEDLLGDRAQDLQALPEMREKPEIGSCSQAEEFFLEIAHGKIRRGGRVNILVDDARRPVLVEKIGLGESHSAMFIRPATICGVTIPPGGLVALRYHADAVPLSSGTQGDILPLAALAEVRFLRLTTLAVSPTSRPRAFNAQFRRQMLGNMLSPHTTTIDDLSRYAAVRLREA